MSDKNTVHNDTCTESDKIHISDISDQAALFSDQSPPEGTDNQEPDTNAIVIDNPSPFAAATTNTSNCDKTMAQRTQKRKMARKTVQQSNEVPCPKTSESPPLAHPFVAWYDNIPTSKTAVIKAAEAVTSINSADSSYIEEERDLKFIELAEDNKREEDRERYIRGFSLEALDLSLPSLDSYQEEFERPGNLISSQRGGRRRIKVTPDILGHPRCDKLKQICHRRKPIPISPLADIELPKGYQVDACQIPDHEDDPIIERLGELAPMTTPAPPIPQLSAIEERMERRNWRSCVVQGIERRIDMKVIEPYKRVLSHGGYLQSSSHNAIIVFSACFLPDRRRRDYDYVMDNLFLYVLTTLDQLITEDYLLVYLHGATQRSCMPTFSWLKRCYHLIDRRLRKNLKGLFLVHPTFWLKTIVLMTKPFISSKFSCKLRFINSIAELAAVVPLELASIPDKVKQLDDDLEERAAKRRSLLSWWWTQSPDTTTVSS